MKGYSMPGNINTNFRTTHLPGLQELPRIHNPTKEHFFENYVNKRQPVVITGLMKNKEMNKWSDFCYLKNKIGKKHIQPRVNGGRSVFCNTSKISFESFLDQASKHDLYLSLALIMGPSYDSFNRYYRRKSHPAYLPELASDLDIPFIDRKDIWEVNLWLGANNSETPMHTDEMENLFFQIRGKKRFLFFPMVDNPGWEEDKRNEHGEITYKGFEVLLNPGEVLYFPSYYHHRVFGDDKWSVSCNVWFLRRWQDIAAFVSNKPLEHIPSHKIALLKTIIKGGVFMHNLLSTFHLLRKIPKVKIGPPSFAKSKAKEVN